MTGTRSVTTFHFVDLDPSVDMRPTVQVSRRGSTIPLDLASTFAGSKAPAGRRFSVQQTGDWAELRWGSLVG